MPPPAEVQDIVDVGEVDVAIPTPAAVDNAAATQRPQLIELLLDAGVLTQQRLTHAERIQQRLETPLSLLSVVKRLGFVDEQGVRKAIHDNPGRMRLGDLLVELGIVTDDDVRAALAVQKRPEEHRRLGEILVANRAVSESKLVEMLGSQLGLEMVEPVFVDMDRTLLERVNIAWCRESAMVPLSNTEHGVQVAFADPLNQDHVRRAEQMLSRPVEALLARRSLIDEALNAYERTLTKSAVQSESNSVVTFDKIIREALEEGASDVHIEPLRGYMRVRFRIDGAMLEHCRIEAGTEQSLVTRIKVLAQANITERRRHQDGRILFEDHEQGHRVDIRASFYVTIYGEKVVLRLLNRPTELMSIDRIGMRPRMLDRFRMDALDVPTGVVIITGPTGSGKTTTLYSCVDHLNNPDTSIVTAEDPVEYVIDGIAQCSIDPKINLTFDETLRHIVRQDPDVIVLGEIRDKFSADTAIQAALTGHKVLTTFHTEDSIGGLLRLMNMEIEAFLISSTVVSVVAQRLLRRVCEHCAEPYKPRPAELRPLGYTNESITSSNFRIGRGCGQCRHTGFRGRVGVYELLVLNERVKDAILNRRTSYEIRAISVESSGLVTLLEDGLVKAADGITSLTEVVRHLPRVLQPRPLGEIRRLLGV